MGHIKNSLKSHALNRLTLALLGTVFDVGPILGPFFAPLKGQAAAVANLGFKPVLGLGYRWHDSTLFEWRGSLYR